MCQLSLLKPVSVDCWPPPSYMAVFTRDMWPWECRGRRANTVLTSTPLAQSICCINSWPGVRMMTECSRITDAPAPTPNELTQKAVHNKNIRQQQPNRQENQSQLCAVHFDQWQVMKETVHPDPSGAMPGKEGEGTASWGFPLTQISMGRSCLRRWVGGLGECQATASAEAGRQLRASHLPSYGKEITGVSAPWQSGLCCKTFNWLPKERAVHRTPGKGWPCESYFSFTPEHCIESQANLRV